VLTFKVATFPTPEIGPVLRNVAPINHVAVPDPVEDVPVSVMLVFVQVSMPFEVAEIPTIGAWLFCVIVVEANAVQPFEPVTVTV
jgi:hypothetical protein